MVSTTVNLCGIELANPVIPASGTFGYGHEFAEIYDINCLGAFSIKGTTRVSRFGNPAPRIADAPAGMLNSVGLQNPGVEAVIARELPELSKVYHKKVLANVCGFSVDEYVEVAARLDKEDIVGWLELNVSCPNVHGGGMGFGTTCEGAATVTREVKRAVQKPVIVNLAMRIDPAARKPVLANVTGGLSGGAVFPLALRCVYQVYEAVGIPIIGMGGVGSARDAIEMMLAGAAAVGVGAANLTNPYAAKEIIDALPAEMEKYGIENLADIIGGAHNG